MTDPAGLVLDDPKDHNAASRSRIYALFGEALAYPEGHAALRLMDGDLLADLKDGINSLAASVECPFELLVPSGPSALGELQRHYSDLFDVASGTPAVSLLERRYGEEPEQKLWEKLLAFYSHFGLNFSDGNAPEQPDHLLTELAFMHYLSFLEAGADQGSGDLRRGQRDFLKLHLACWISPLSEKLSELNPHSPFTVLVNLLDRFIAIDFEYLDATGSGLAFCPPNDA